MGILDRLSRGQDTPPARTPRALRAAGARVNLDAPEPVMLRRHQWQTDAWGYRDTVPEMRFAMDFVSDALGRLRIFAAENRSRGEDPVAFGTDGLTVSPQSQAVARDAIDRLDLDKHGSSILSRAGENIDVAGECYLLGELQPGGAEQWSIRSVSEIKLAGERIQLVEPGKSSGGRELDPATSDLLRLWKPHPQFYDWPDSGMSASLEYAEELRLISRRIRATHRSRLGSGALFYLPNEFSLTRPGSAAVPVGGTGLVDEDDDPLMEELTTALLAPIADESDPSAVVPILIRGPAMIGDKPALGLIGAVEIPRQDAGSLADDREKATKAFARGIKLPPEILMGIGDVNHWSGAVIDAATCKNYIEPRAEVLCDALTMAYLRPSMQAAGCPPEDIARTVLWFDASELVENPDRGKDAKDTHDRGAISDEVLRRSTGFGEEDAPDVYERVFRAIERRAISDQQLPVLLAAAGLPADDPLVVAAVAAARAGQAAGPAQIRGPQVVDAEPVPTPDATPAPEPEPRTASAAPDERAPAWQVDEQLCRQLGEVDAQLLSRLLAHCEATVGRAVERAATRIKARSQRDEQLAAAFRGRDQVAVVASLGRARCSAFAEDDDVADSIEALHSLWTRTVGDASYRIAELVGRLLGRPPSQELVARLVRGGERGWSWLAPRLARLAQRLLFGEAELPVERGEESPGIVPVGLVRGALGEAGGRPADDPGVDEDGQPTGPRRPGPPPGLGSGDEVVEHMHANGAVDLGYEWSYFGVQRKAFPPHLALSGRRFSEFNDPMLSTRPEHLGWLGPFYAPGDHKGCMCSVHLIWAAPSEQNEDVRKLADEAVLHESPKAAERRRLLAEADDRAGRVGTDAQKKRDLHDELVRLRQQHIQDREVPLS